MVLPNLVCAANLEAHLEKVLAALSPPGTKGVHYNRKTLPSQNLTCMTIEQ